MKFQLWKRIKFAARESFRYWPHLILFPFDIIYVMIKCNTLDLWAAFKSCYVPLVTYCMYMQWNPKEEEDFNKYAVQTLEDPKKRYKFLIVTVLFVDIPLICFCSIYFLSLLILLRHLFN